MSRGSLRGWGEEDGGRGLAVGGILLFGPGRLVAAERFGGGVARLGGIGRVSLPLHRVEVIHIGLIGLFIVAQQAHCSYPPRYSTTFGTRKKWFSVAGAFLTISSAISPSVTTSVRFFISIGVTEVIGSTPATLTSDNCSTKASIAFSSP